MKTRRVCETRAWRALLALLLGCGGPVAGFIEIGAAADTPAEGSAKGDVSRPTEIRLAPAERNKKLDELEHLKRQAGALSARAEYDKAVPVVLKARELCKLLFSENSPEYATCLNYLALLYRDQGDYPRAEDVCRHALQIRKKILAENDPDYAQSLNNLALIRQDQGDYPGAKPLFRQAVEICKKTSNDLGCATSLNNLANLYREQGDYRRAEPLLRKALEIFKRVGGENDPDYANSLNNLAALYWVQGDCRGAETLCRQALEILKKLLGENHPAYAACLNDLGLIYWSEHDYRQAEPLVRQALEIREKVLPKNHPDYAQSLNNLALLCEAQGDYLQAEPLFRRAFEICVNLGENYPPYAVSLNNLAHLYQAQGDYRRAEPLFRRALEIRKKVLGENHPAYAQSLNNLALLYWDQGDYPQAEPLFRQAVTIIHSHIEATAIIQSERQQLAMLQANRYYLDGYLGLAVDSGQYSEPAYRELLAWKGMVLRRNRLARAGMQSPELAATFTRLQRVARQLTHLAWATPDPRQEANWRQRVAKLSAEMEQLEAELSARSAEYRQAKQAVPLEELQGALSKDCVLVDFVEYSYQRPPDKKSGSKAMSERRLAAFVVAPDRPVEMVSLRAMQPIDEAIETWRVTFGMSADGAGAARRLRERLWAPLEEKLRGAKIVLISPDGALSRLPFGALPGKTPGSYLIEDFTFAVVPVPQLIPQLVREEGRKQLRKKLLLLGNVDYDAPPAKSRIGFQPVSKDAPNDDDATPGGDGLRPSSRSLRPGTLHFAPLPGTEGEIAAIEDVYRHAVGSEGVTALRKSQAGKEAFLAEARQYGYLHLATHGFFIEERVPRAAVGSHESGPLQAMVRGPEAGASYPALLSGLALAGANRSAEQQPSPPAPLPSTGEGSKSPSPPAPLPAGEGSKLSSPPAPLPQALEGRQEDDGILAAEEIGVQNLNGVEIVVLSACQSGLGKQASGEGVLGLQRSFQSAGARSVVASLWSVDDAATKSLMVEFYKNLWEKKLPKLEALRQAQLTMLREYNPKAGKLRGPGPERPVAPEKLAGAKEVPPGQKSLSPLYWASFVLSGDWK